MAEIIRTSFKPYELLFADIVELEMTKEQEDFLRTLSQEKSKDYIFATKNQIKSEGMAMGTDSLKDNIANHSYKILTENPKKLMMRDDKDAFI